MPTRKLWLRRVNERLSGGPEPRSASHFPSAGALSLHVSFNPQGGKELFLGLARKHPYVGSVDAPTNVDAFGRSPARYHQRMFAARPRGLSRSR
jgi:hypothetical protein